jgi:hypothetical protein
MRCLIEPEEVSMAQDKLKLLQLAFLLNFLPHEVQREAGIVLPPVHDMNEALTKLVAHGGVVCHV